MFLSALSRALAICSLYFRLLVLRLQLFFSQTKPLYKSHTKRSILLLGDGTAEGFGDTFGKTGLPSRLSKLLAEEESLRFSWRIVSAGKLWTTAKDWHPTKGTLFPKAIKDQGFCDADVVILSFGMHDNPLTVSENVATIVDAIVRMGKHVVVAGLFNPHSPRTEQHDAFRRANQDLERRIDLIKQRSTSPKCGSLSFGADPAKVCAMGTDTLSEETGFYAFNSRGYRFFAADLVDDVIAAAKRVEWQYWKERLARAAS